MTTAAPHFLLPRLAPLNHYSLQRPWQKGAPFVNPSPQHLSMNHRQSRRQKGSEQQPSENLGQLVGVVTGQSPYPLPALDSDSFLLRDRLADNGATETGFPHRSEQFRRLLG